MGNWLQAVAPPRSAQLAHYLSEAAGNELWAPEVRGRTHIPAPSPDTLVEPLAQFGGVHDLFVPVSRPAVCRARGRCGRRGEAKHASRSGPHDRMVNPQGVVSVIICGLAEVRI